MKLEPVAWQFRFKAKLGEWRGCSSGDALLYGNMAEYETRALYAIHDGYVVVPVDELLAALAALIRPDDPLESLGGSARDRAFNFGVETAINRCKDLIASKDGAANVAAYTPKTVVNGYLLEACPKCGCFGSESPCAVCKLRAASPKEQS